MPRVSRPIRIQSSRHSPEPTPELPPEATPVATMSVKSAQPTTLDQFPTQDMFDETFQVKVGEGSNKRSCTLHQTTAAFYSGYFAAAVKKDAFLEGKDKIITISDMNPDAFVKVVGWIYTRQLPATTAGECDQLVEMWVLADRLMMPMLCNAILTMIWQEAIRLGTPPAKSCRLIYESTMEGSGIRRLVAFLFATCYAKTSEAMRDFPKEALYDVIKSTWEDHGKGVNSRSFFTWSFPAMLHDVHPCKFHTHDLNEKCPGVK